MINEKIKNKLGNIREVLLTLILAVWILIPFFKETKITCIYALKCEYPFILITGSIGLICFIYNVYKEYKNKDKKQFIKEMLPVIFFIIFMLWTLISAVLSKNIKNAFWGSDYRKDGYISYLAYAGFFGCAFLIQSRELKKVLINLFIGVAVLDILLIELANHGYLTGMFFQREIRRTCFYNINHYAYYLLLATISANFLFITEKNKLIKIIYVLAYAFLLYYLILNNTLGTYLALVLTLILFLVYCIYNKKRKLLAITSIVILVIISLVVELGTNSIIKGNFSRLFDDIMNISVAEKAKRLNWADKDKKIAISEAGGSGRIKLWKYGIEFFIQNPILGYGPENLEELYKEKEIIQDRPHNLFIQQATTSGIIGLVTYTSAIRNNFNSRA